MREDVLSVKENLRATIQNIHCITIGTHRYKSTEPVVFTSKGVRIVANCVKNPNEKCVINVMRPEIVKAICYFGDGNQDVSAIILHVLNSCSEYVRDQLEMTSM